MKKILQEICDELEIPYWLELNEQNMKEFERMVKWKKKE